MTPSSGLAPPAARLTQRAIRHPRGARAPLPRGAAEPAPHERAVVLTEREQQVVDLATLGHDNQLIAYSLGSSRSTVRVLIANAAQKLHASSRLDLVQRYGVASLRER